MLQACPFASPGRLLEMQVFTPAFAATKCPGDSVGGSQVRVWAVSYTSLF